MTLREYAKLMNDTALQGNLSNEEYNRLYLHRQFIHSDNGHGKSVVIIVNGASGFAGLDHLGQAVQLGIGDCKVDV